VPESGRAELDPYPEVPPTDAEFGRFLAVPGAVVNRFATDDVLSDVLSAMSPDMIVATEPEPGVVRPSLAGIATVPVLRPGRGMRTEVVSAADGRVVFVIPPAADDLPETPASLLEELDGKGDEPASAAGGNVATPPGDVQVCLVTDELSLTVDPHSRTTTLDGVSAYAEALPPTWTAPDVVHLSTGLREGYSTTYEGEGTGTRLRIEGAGPPIGGLGVGVDDATLALSTVDVAPNGAVTTESIDPERFGLRGLDGVSEARARRLREAGLSDRSAVAEASATELARLDSVGSGTAARILDSARALAEGRVVPRSDASLPNGDPVFVDVETDGLAASAAWLVGVLDGDAEDGRYLAFRETDPRDPAAHLDAFMTWLTGSARGRPVVAWNGYWFDFEVIREQLREHCPEHVDAWDDRYTFDPLYWADRQDNAALPGRTNQLEDVAGALGWQSTTTGIDGATVARIYTTWRNRVETADDPASVPAPDWTRLEAYCEDDVRALATIYGALEDAARRDPETRAPTGAGSDQGSLTDFT
jgi:uncharacterized protein YprB with RNaseH-like and TPR domain